MPSEPKTVYIATRFRVVEHKIPQALQSEPLIKHSVQHPGAVAMIPLLDDGSVCLIRNYRVSVGKTFIELPAGTLESNEPPRQTAERELKEETGFSATDWQELPSFSMSPGILNERMHLFVAQGLTPGDPAREPGEEIENLIVPWDKAIAMSLNGEIEDAKTLAGLLMWDRLRDRLHQGA